MIFQNIPIDNSAALAEALTAAGLARQELARTQEQLAEANENLADADAALAELGVNI